MCVLVRVNVVGSMRFFFFSGNVLCVFVCMCDVEALLPKDCAIFLFTCVRMCMYM